MINNFDFTNQLIGNYRITGSLGEGGMAVIYKALDTQTNKVVAIKFLRPSLNNPTLAIKRFEREAQTLFKLSHPDIVQVLGFGDHQGWPYLVMEYLPGGTLRQKTGKPINWQTSAGMLLPVARALKYAHEKGITHRDIKPANVLLTQTGQLKLSDFGIAKLTGGDEMTTDLTATGLGVGTPDYMAPEQFNGSADPSVDIYALGVLFYEMVTGVKPYTAATPAGIILKKNSEPPVSPRRLIGNLPAEIEGFLLKILQPDPRARFQSMAEVLAIMENLASGKLIIPGAVKQITHRWKGITSIFITLIVVGITASLAIFSPFTNTNRNTQPSPEVVTISDLSTPTTPPAVTAMASPTLTQYLFQDEFSDLASGWDQGNTAEFLTDYQDGGYRIWINSLEKTAWSTPGLNFTSDVRIEVYATKHGGPDNNAFGLLCRHKRTETGFSFYFFYITSQGGAAIGKYIDNTPIYLANSPEQIPAINQGPATNRINIDCFGENLILYANGVPILGATDSSLQEGDVGLIARTYKEIGTDILFDNFNVAMP